MFRLEDENERRSDVPIVSVKAPTEFPHDFHVYAAVSTLGIWLPIYLIHYLIAKLRT